MKRALRLSKLLPPDERGIALPLALMALMVLGALSTALLTIGTSEIQITYNHLRGTQALFVADAGLERAFVAFAADSSKLSSLDGLPTSGTLAGGSFALSYQAAGTNTVLVTSTGTIGGAQKVLRATITDRVVVDDAVRTKDDITIVGNANILGSCGSVHTNDVLSITGNSVNIDVSATASGTAGGDYRTGSPPDQTTVPSVGNQRKRVIPKITADGFLEMAKADATASAALYKLGADGTRYKYSAGVFFELTTTTTPALSTLNDWTYTAGNETTPAQWSIIGNSAPTGTFLVEGNISVSGAPGSAGTPLAMTLLAKDTQGPTSTNRGGNITIGGTPNLTSHLSGVQLVADRDILTTGNFTAGTTANTNSFIFAHEQIRIGGTPTINGAVVAEDAASSSTVVGANSIPGTPTIRLNCGGGTETPGPVRFLSWGL